MTQSAPTLAETFERLAQQYTTRAFLKDKYQKSWREHSWSGISERAMRLRAGMVQLGVKAGDRVAILSENSPEWVVVDQAVLGLGGIVIPLYTTSGADELRHVISDSGARLIAVNGDQLTEKVGALHLPGVERILLMHRDSRDCDRGTISLGGASAFEPMPAREGRRDDLATFIYTSGTTGPPKGAMLSHGNILANCESSLPALSLSANDQILSFLPVAHSFERTAGSYSVMLAGGTIAYAEGLGQIAHNLLEIEPTVLLTVPRLLEVIYSRIMRTIESSPGPRQKIFRAAIALGSRAADCRHHELPLPLALRTAMPLARRLVFAKIRGIFGRRLRYLISGGAPLPTDINRLLAAAEVPIVEGYGLTEASPVVSVNTHGHTRIGTVGRPIRDVEVRTAPDGELLVKGANVMQGYYGREADTSETIDADGWLHTGDIARIDHEGYITITDRKKEIIVLSGGKNLSPAYLETKLVSDPYIAQACVIGDRRKHLAAVIVPDFEHLAEHQPDKFQLERQRPETLATDGELREFFRARIRQFNKPLSDVEAIADFILTAQPFSQENGELTPTMKVRRKVVQDHYSDQIRAMYGE